MPIDFATEIESIMHAIASGATMIAYDGKKVDYGSLQELLARLRWLQDQLDPEHIASRSMSSVAAFDRGDL